MHSPTWLRQIMYCRQAHPLPLTYRVVAERAHAQPDLAQVEHVLQAGRLAQVDPMGDVLAQHVGRHKVVNVAGLQAGRGSEGEGELHRWIPWACRAVCVGGRGTKGRSRSPACNTCPCRAPAMTTCRLPALKPPNCHRHRLTSPACGRKAKVFMPRASLNLLRV